MIETGNACHPDCFPLFHSLVHILLGKFGTGPTWMPSAQKNKDSKWKARNAQLPINGNVWVLGSFFVWCFLFSSSMFFPTRSQPTRTGKHLKELMCKGSLYMVDSNNHVFSDVTLVPLIQSACKMFAKRWLDSWYVSNVCLLTLVQNIWLAEVKKTVHDILSFQSLVLGTCPLTFWWIGADLSPMWSVFFRCDRDRP